MIANPTSERPVSHPAFQWANCWIRQILPEDLYVMVRAQHLLLSREIGGEEGKHLVHVFTRALASRFVPTRRASILKTEFDLASLLELSACMFNCALLRSNPARASRFSIFSSNSMLKLAPFFTMGSANASCTNLPWLMMPVRLRHGRMKLLNSLADMHGERGMTHFVWSMPSMMAVMTTSPSADVPRRASARRFQ